MKHATKWAEEAINRALEEQGGMPITLLIGRIGIRVTEAVEGAVEEALDAERARMRPLLERAEDAVRDHDFPKGHKYDVLVGDLRDEMSRKGHSTAAAGEADGRR